jgi:hypothetical protein
MISPDPDRAIVSQSVGEGNKNNVGRRIFPENLEPDAANASIEQASR